MILDRRRLLRQLPAIEASMAHGWPICAAVAAACAAAIMLCPWGQWAATLGSQELPHGARTDVTSELLRGMHISQRDNATLMDFLETIAGEEQPFAGRTMIVTGASRGLGRGIAVVLLAAGINLGLPLRTVSEGLVDDLQAESEALRRGILGDVPPRSVYDVPSIRLWQMDLADLSSIQACVREMSSANFRASAVINNAGLTSPYDEVTAQGYELTVGVNFVGTVQFTLDLLKAGVITDTPSSTGTADYAGRAVMVSSEEHRAENIEPLQMRYPTAGSFCKPNANADGGMHNAMRRYATSKLLLTTFSHELARRNQDIEVIDVCPGPVASDIARAAPWPINQIVAWGMRQTFQTPERAALPVVKLALHGAAAFHGLSKAYDGGGGRGGGGGTASHFHMSERRVAVDEATDAANGEWIWGMTKSVLYQ